MLVSSNNVEPGKNGNCSHNNILIENKFTKAIMTYSLILVYKLRSHDNLHVRRRNYKRIGIARVPLTAHRYFNIMSKLACSIVVCCNVLMAVASCGTNAVECASSYV